MSEEVPRPAAARHSLHSASGRLVRSTLNVNQELKVKVLNPEKKLDFEKRCPAPLEELRLATLPLPSAYGSGEMS
jgi:hypothetical protein